MAEPIDTLEKLIYVYIIIILLGAMKRRRVVCDRLDITCDVPVYDISAVGSVSAGFAVFETSISGTAINCEVV